MEKHTVNSNPIMPSGVTQNPLTKYFRTPKNYVRLPSRGKFYSPGSIKLSETNEYAVYPMTAKDELILKTPDALLNGESTVQVIKSCVPEITNPWDMPSIDLDAILIAIRLATYGENMEIKYNVPGINEERVFVLDLRTLLDQFIGVTFDQYIEIDDYITVEVRPLSYKEFTQNAQQTFEEQRILRLVNDNTISEDKKVEAFQQSFKKLTTITLNLVLNSIVCIDTPEGKVTNRKHISEFLENADRTVFNKILKHLESIKEKTTIKPIKVTMPTEDIERGAPETFEIPILFDQSNFFV
jgi:hypothetical protein